MNLPIGIVAYRNSANTLLNALYGEQVKLWTPKTLAAAPAVPPNNSSNTIESVDFEALRDTPVIFMTIPALHVRTALSELGEVITGRHIVVHSCRNVESKTLMPISKVIEAETSVKRIGFLTGPLAADDLNSGRVVASSCATEFPEVADVLQNLLARRVTILERLPDIGGAEAAANFARVVAFAYQLVASLDVGRSASALLTCTGIREAREYVVYSGGYEQTTYSLAGLGNYNFDITGEGSTDVAIARAIASRDTHDIPNVRDFVESEFADQGRDFVRLIESLHAQLQHSKLNTELLDACHRLLFNNTTPRDAFRRFAP